MELLLIKGLKLTLTVCDRAMQKQKTVKKNAQVKERLQKAIYCAFGIYFYEGKFKFSQKCKQVGSAIN